MSHPGSTTFGRPLHVVRTRPLAVHLPDTAWVDHDHPDVRAMAAKLRGSDPVATARACFEFVRDEIRHAGDHHASPTTCRASDVLRERQGWCFAKSHLLVALLRANDIPSALCYQRLTIDDGRFTLHGLASVELPGHGWYRVDPRGNKPGVDARFEPPVERLAFAPRLAGESDIDGRFSGPLPEVVRCLTTHATSEAVLADLPDRERLPPG